MQTWLKIVLVIVAVGVVVVVGIVAAGYLWWRSNAEEMRERAEVVKVEGREYGSSSTPTGCLDEALLRLDGDSGIMHEAMTRAFFSSCLGAAPEDPAFCRGVPPPTEIMATVNWSLSTCAGLRRPQDQSCARLVREIQEHCHPDG
jgi:hypothetical protein